MIAPHPPMRIAGLQKLTLQDFPGTPACIVFTPGCQMACPYCHNPDLSRGRVSDIEVQDIMQFLHLRRERLQGVVITGGEPTLQPGLLDFLTQVRSLGFRIKLDTNGLHPEVVAAACAEGLIDHLALDIKLQPHRYQELGGPADSAERLAATRATAASSGVTVEIRTTVVEPLHDAVSLAAIADDLRPNERWSLQRFQDGPVLDPDFGCRPPSARLLADARARAEARGIAVTLRN